MTLNLQISKDLEADLQAQAHAKGMSVEEYAAALLRERLVVESHGSVSIKRPDGRKSLAQLFADSPLKGLDLKFERDLDTGRPIEL